LTEEQDQIRNLHVQERRFASASSFVGLAAFFPQSPMIIQLLALAEKPVLSKKISVE
jgi:hypothetical protein